jgi:hypothetical protein
MNELDLRGVVSVVALVVSFVMRDVVDVMRDVVDGVE